MANLKNINLMSQGTFESIEQADDELYAVSASGIGFPSSRYEDLTLGASDTQYTAPANGWFVLSKSTAATNQVLSIRNDTTGFSVNSYCPASGQVMRLHLPCKKNDVIAVGYTASGATNFFRFIYAEGE